MNVNQTVPVVTHTNMIDTRFNNSFRPFTKSQINECLRLTYNSCWFFKQ